MRSTSIKFAVIPPRFLIFSGLFNYEPTLGGSILSHPVYRRFYLQELGSRKTKFYAREDGEIKKVLLNFALDVSVACRRREHLSAKQGNAKVLRPTTNQWLVVLENKNVPGIQNVSWKH